MIITKKENGDLSIMAESVDERRKIYQLVREFGDFPDGFIEGKFVERFLPDYKTILPEDCGALTSCTLITMNEIGGTGDVWGDMNYQVQSMLEELILGNAVTFFKG